MDDFIRFECPACGKSLKAKANQIGKRIRCPGKTCGEPTVVPNPVPAKGERIWPWLVGAATTLIFLVTLGVWYLNSEQRQLPSEFSSPNEQVAAKKVPARQPNAKKTKSPAEKPGIKQPSKEGTTLKDKKPALTQTLSLPGAKGPRLERVGKLPPGVELSQVYMTAQPFTPPSDPLPTTFASGTSSLDVVIAFKGQPPGGTLVGRKALGKDGSIKLKGFVLIASFNNATGLFEMPLECALAAALSGRSVPDEGVGQ